MAGCQDPDFVVPGCGTRRAIEHPKRLAGGGSGAHPIFQDTGGQAQGPPPKSIGDCSEGVVQTQDGTIGHRHRNGGAAGQSAGSAQDKGAAVNVDGVGDNGRLGRGDVRDAGAVFVKQGKLVWRCRRGRQGAVDVDGPATGEVEGAGKGGARVVDSAVDVQRGAGVGTNGGVEVQPEGSRGGVHAVDALELAAEINATVGGVGGGLQRDRVAYGDPATQLQGCARGGSAWCHAHPTRSQRGGTGSADNARVDVERTA